MKPSSSLFGQWLRCWLAICGLCASSAAWSWGADGHRSVGAIAERWLAGSRAGAQVERLLGGVGLQDATVWADCVKGIAPDQGYAYGTPGRFPECKPFETPAGMAEMADFVRRNDRPCRRSGPGAEGEPCHKGYHYTDIAIQREAYAAGLVGARDADVVAALQAAIAVLGGRPCPAPFAIAGPREALLMAAHLVGDLHQPLHVGAIYLDPQGRPVDPDAAGVITFRDTRGGNQITTGSGPSPDRRANLHQFWDEVPPSLKAAQVDARWLARARAVPVTPGAPASWPVIWASQTLQQARQAYQGLRFGPRQGSEWTVSLSADDELRRRDIQQVQLTLAGARLAQLLEAIWP